MMIEGKIPILKTSDIMVAMVTIASRQSEQSN